MRRRARDGATYGAYLLTVIETLAGAAGAGVVIELLRRRLRRKREDQLAAGHSVHLPAKLRIVDGRGVTGRWREGIVIVREDTSTFRPRRPRLGARFDLTGSRVMGTRPKGRMDAWWFAGPTVLALVGPPGRFELASGSDADIGMLATVFRQSGAAEPVD